jgi:hypothetical protein
MLMIGFLVSNQLGQSPSACISCPDRRSSEGVGDMTFALVGRRVRSIVSEFV